VARIDLANIQAFVHRFFHERDSFHLMFELPQTPAARKFLAAVAPLITYADVAPLAHPPVVAALGITANGLKALGLSAEQESTLPLEFRESPNPGSLGDFGASRPDTWWHQQFKSDRLHVMVQLHANSRDAMAPILKTIRDAAAANQVKELFPTKDGQPLTGEHLPDRKLHFGYRDGISQPRIGWDDATRAANEVDFRQIILGYSTTEVPSEPQPGSAAESLIRDSSYLVLRWLYQDAATFERFLTDASSGAPGSTPAERKEWLASKIVGRWRDGTPTALSPNEAKPALVANNQFGYATNPDGQNCPVNAHIRVMNPRDSKLAFSEPKTVPRLVRRGVPYGPPLVGSTDDGVDRGLIGLFLCASIRRQFYVLTNWMQKTDFVDDIPLTAIRRQDPFGNREVPESDHDFSVTGPPSNRTVTLQQFVRTQGTAFFLTPSRSTLDQLKAP
jgi:Dyp-type peroxidase family